MKRTDLDIVDDTAFELAAKVVREGGQVHPTVLVCANEKALVYPAPSPEEAAAALAVASRHPGVSVAASMDEAWYVVGGQGDPFPDAKPSEHPDRKECVVVLIVQGGTIWMCNHEIKRDAAGSTLIRSDRVTGGITGRLVPTPPTAH